MSRRTTFGKSPTTRQWWWAAYPEGEEWEAINNLFDELMVDLKRLRHLTHAEPQIQLPAVQQDVTLEADPQLSLFAGTSKPTGETKKKPPRTHGPER